MRKLIFLSLLACAFGATAVAQESLGSVTIGRSVMADGKPLAAGTYQVRLTAAQPQPAVPGQQLERWVEFLQNGQTRGREVASVVPDADLAQIAKGPKPGRNAARVELLKGNEYLRVWINRNGSSYLLHLPVGG